MYYRHPFALIIRYSIQTQLSMLLFCPLYNVLIHLCTIQVNSFQEALCNIRALFIACKAICSFSKNISSSPHMTPPSHRSEKVSCNRKILVTDILEIVALLEG